MRNKSHSLSCTSLLPPSSLPLPAFLFPLPLASTQQQQQEHRAEERQREGGRVGRQFQHRAGVTALVSCRPQDASAVTSPVHALGARACARVRRRARRQRRDAGRCRLGRGAGRIRTLDRKAPVSDRYSCLALCAWQPTRRGLPHAGPPAQQTRGPRSVHRDWHSRRGSGPARAPPQLEILAGG